MSTRGDPAFTFRLPGGAFPLEPRQLRHCVQTDNVWSTEKNIHEHNVVRLNLLWAEYAEEDLLIGMNKHCQRDLQQLF